MEFQISKRKNIISGHSLKQVEQLEIVINFWMKNEDVSHEQLLKNKQNVHFQIYGWLHLELNPDLANCALHVNKTQIGYHGKII